MNLFAAPDVTDRLMLALTPPPQVADLMALAADQVRADLRLPARPRPREQCLVLQSLGEHAGLRRDIVSMSAEAAASVAPPGPLELVFDQVKTRRTAPGRFDLVLTSSAPSTALAAFQKDLGLAMAREGLGRLVDCDFAAQVLVIEDVSQPVLALPIAPIRWTATSFSLLHVLLGHRIHVPLARWPLHAET